MEKNPYRYTLKDLIAFLVTAVVCITFCLSICGSISLINLEIVFLISFGVEELIKSVRTRKDFEETFQSERLFLLNGIFLIIWSLVIIGSKRVFSDIFYITIVNLVFLTLFSLIIKKEIADREIVKR